MAGKTTRMIQREAQTNTKISNILGGCMPQYKPRLDKVESCL
jgi:hypothetical protein